MASVNLAPIYENIINPVIQQLMLGAALAIGSWLTYLIHKYAPPFVRGWLEDKASTDLNTALNNGVAIAMQKVTDVEKLHSDVQVKSDVAAFAANYAATHAPGAMKAFGLDLDELAVKALAYLPPPPMSGIGTTGAKVATVQVSVQPLGKI